MNENRENALNEQLAKQILGEGATKEIIIREGEALPVKEPLPVSITGQIDAPARWLEKRAGIINPEAAHVLVCREKLAISIIIEEKSEYRDRIDGVLQLSEEMNKLGINKGIYITSFEMSDLIKRNRTYFENTQVAMKLVTELRNFKAKVDKEIEASDDKRGNRRMLAAQVVESNLPENFTIEIPVFKGQAKTKIQVEVEVNPDDLTCTLVSPEANDIVQKERDSIMDGVLDRIHEAAPGIVIIEQ